MIDKNILAWMIPGIVSQSAKEIDPSNDDQRKAAFANMNSDSDSPGGDLSDDMFHHVGNKKDGTYKKVYAGPSKSEVKTFSQLVDKYTAQAVKDGIATSERATEVGKKLREKFKRTKGRDIAEFTRIIKGQIKG